MSNCKACNKEIFFLKTNNGKLIPVNAESLNHSELHDLKNNPLANGQRLFDSKRHVTHFADCPKADKYRR